MRISPTNALPLLTKELVEQSAKWRTYALRIVFALSVFVIVGFTNYELLIKGASSSDQVGGHGVQIFKVLLIVEFVGVFVLMPAMISGVVIREKENDTLTLLLLTELRPWEIIIQKLGGRIITMFSFVLMGMPILGVAYAYGGISANHLWASVFLLLLTMFQVGSISIMFSAYCRTHNTSLLSSYLMGPVLYFASFILILIVGIFGYLLLLIISQLATSGTDLIPLDDIWFGVFPPLIMFTAPDKDWYWLLIFSIPAILVSLFWCKLAVNYMITRSVRSTRYLVTLSSVGDTEEVGWVDPDIGVITRVRKRSDLPGDQPVDWLERSRRSFADQKSQAGLLAYIAVVFGLFELLFLFDDTSGHHVGLSTIFAMKLLLIFIIILFAAVSLFQTDRLGQTIDVLLATPLTGHEILSQKMKFLRGWLITSCILFAPTIFFQFTHVFRESIHKLNSGFSALTYACLATAMVFVYLNFILYLSTYIGLNFMTRAHQVMIAIIVVLGWMFVPLVLLMMAAAIFPQEMMIWELIHTAIGPLGAFWQLENPDYVQASTLKYFNLTIILNLAIYAVITWLIRKRCFNNIERYLRRM